MNSKIDDWLTYENKKLILKTDISISLEIIETSTKEYYDCFVGDFVEYFHDKKAYQNGVVLNYNNMPIKYYRFVGADNGRVWIANPDEEYNITKEEYMIGLFVNIIFNSESYKEDEYKNNINRAKINISE